MEKERKRERSLREKRGKKSDSLNGSERNFLRTSPSKKKKSLGDEDCCFFPSQPLRARFARRHREPTVRAAPTLCSGDCRAARPNAESTEACIRVATAAKKKEQTAREKKNGDVSPISFALGPSAEGTVACNPWPHVSRTMQSFLRVKTCFRTTKGARTSPMELGSKTRERASFQLP
jgi:hypothetical protein